MGARKFKVLGGMSGTSLDGLDLCFVEFEEVSDQWQFRWVRQETFSYDQAWVDQLTDRPLSGRELIDLDRRYGRFLGDRMAQFIDTVGVKPDLIGSHGHTLYHEPQRGFSCQLGHGAYIAAACGVPVVSDFRSSDIALGGQGAPLVPFGDAHLFAEYEACVNLGGFANISCAGRAYDICAVNVVMNKIAQRMGQAYDDRGSIARSGQVDTELLDKLNALPFYSQQPPKSLGVEWVERHVFPLLLDVQMPLVDLMATYSAHVAEQLIRHLPQGRVLVTGGGAYNEFLMEQVRHRADGAEVHIPGSELVEFKEALIFAFLALKRWLGEPNILCETTGAKRSASAGCIHLP